MDINLINQHLATGNPDYQRLLPHAYRLSQAPYIFPHEFGLEKLPTEPGILMIRGARQYGKSTWLEQQVIQTIKEFGAGSAYYLNGDFLADAKMLTKKLETLAISFSKEASIKRIFIDEITAIDNWESSLKKLVDGGLLRDVLVITTGSKATDLRRGAERLPGRKGKLDKTNYLFTPISYQSFYEICHKKLKDKTLNAYLISGGSPVACSELAQHGFIPEYVIQLVRDWIEGEIAKEGRHRSTLLNLMGVLFRFGGTPVGQSKLSREAGLTNNTVAQGYIEILNDLGCVIPAYPFDVQKNNLILRKPCKYHFMNLLAATTYHPAQIRSPEDFEKLSAEEQGIWHEWLISQELQRRSALRGEELLMPQSFWQSKQNEIDFYDKTEKFIEVKRGKSNPLEFAWFAKQQFQDKLTVINKNTFATDYLNGISLHDFLLTED